MSPRTGRPTDNPKGTPIHVRLDKESEETLFIKSLEIIENFIEKAKGESDEEIPEL